MANRPDEPNFVQAWLKDLSDEVNDCWYRIIPVWFLLFFGAAGAAACFLPEEFWFNRSNQSVGNATVVYSAILTLNGIIVALSWSAFSKIYEMIGAGKFSEFLQRHNVLEGYLFLVRYVHFFQIVALSFSMIGLLAAQFDLIPIGWQRILFILLVGFGAYAVKEATKSVGVMQDLVRYRAIFDAAGSGGNVLPIDRTA